jgi:hypothetical protein
MPGILGPTLNVHGKIPCTAAFQISMDKRKEAAQVRRGNLRHLIIHTFNIIASSASCVVFSSRRLLLWYYYSSAAVFGIFCRTCRNYTFKVSN